MAGSTTSAVVATTVPSSSGAAVGVGTSTRIGRSVGRSGPIASGSDAWGTSGGKTKVCAPLRGGTAASLWPGVPVSQAFTASCCHSTTKVKPISSEYLAAHQREIETALAPKAAKGAVFLYDVTSVYFEGEHNELAAFGYNRDGKRGKQQMVAGLLTDGTGEPLAIQLYAGNTSDPPTFLDAVEQLKVRFGTEEIAVVGDY